MTPSQNHQRETPLLISDHVQPSAGPTLLTTSQKQPCQRRARKQQAGQACFKRPRYNPGAKAEPASDCREATTFQMRGIYHDYQRNRGWGGRETGLGGERPRSRQVPEEPAAGRVRTSGLAPAGDPSCAVPSLSLGLLGTTQPEGPTELAAGTALHPTLVLSGPLLPKFTERDKHICRARATGSGLCGA